MSDTAVSRPEATRLDALAVLRARPRLDTGATVALRLVYAGVGAYALLFVSAAVVHYLVFKSPRFDLGDMVQAIWSTQHGRFLETTGLNGHLSDRLGYHDDPFLLLFVPLLWIWSSPLLLLVVQALAVSSGALPVFWLARKHLNSPRAGVYFAFAYLLYPATQFNAVTPADGFHPVSFAVPLVLYAIWFLDEERLVAFLAVALLAFTTKEEIPLAVGCLGVWYAVRKGRRLFGLSVFALGLIVTLFDFLWVIPHFSPSGADPFADRYMSVGGTPGGIVHKLFSDPLALVHTVATGHKAAYLLILLVPFLGLWVLEPLLVLGAIPDLAINLLSDTSAQSTVLYQYTAGIVPFLVAASIFGAARSNRHGVRLSAWVLGVVACMAIYSPIYLVANDARELGSPLVSAKARAVSMIPEGVPVAASNQLGGRLSQRRYIYMFPYAIRRARWIIVDANDSTYPHVAVLERSLRKYESSGAWRIAFSSDGIVVLHKRSRSGF